MSRKKRGPVAKEVRNLYYSLLHGRISEEEFKGAIFEIINVYGDSGYILQGIGLTIQSCLQNAKDSEREKVWGLVCETDIRIWVCFDNWVRKIHNRFRML